MWYQKSDFCHFFKNLVKFGIKNGFSDLLSFQKGISRVIFGPPVTTESRGRFESGFGYFEVFKKN